MKESCGSHGSHTCILCRAWIVIVVFLCDAKASHGASGAVNVAVGELTQKLVGAQNYSWRQSWGMVPPGGEIQYLPFLVGRSKVGQISVATFIRSEERRVG